MQFATLLLKQAKLYSSNNNLRNSISEDTNTSTTFISKDTNTTDDSNLNEASEINKDKGTLKSISFKHLFNKLKHFYIALLSSTIVLFLMELSNFL